jgi:methylmalonyl-CoA/ethylmalonyl-CoA epimerase
MIEKIDHIGIAVKDLKKSTELFEKLLGRPVEKTESVPSEGVNTAFFEVGQSHLELLEPTGPETPIGVHIERRGEGIQQMALATDDIYAEMKRLKEAGFILLNDEPKKGANNKLVCFIHPKSANGILVEICQEAK